MILRPGVYATDGSVLGFVYESAEDHTILSCLDDTDFIHVAVPTESVIPTDAPLEDSVHYLRMRTFTQLGDRLVGAVALHLWQCSPGPKVIKAVDQFKTMTVDSFGFEFWWPHWSVVVLDDSNPIAVVNFEDIQRIRRDHLR